MPGYLASQERYGVTSSEGTSPSLKYTQTGAASPAPGLTSRWSEPSGDVSIQQAVQLTGGNDIPFDYDDFRRYVIDQAAAEQESTRNSWVSGITDYNDLASKIEQLNQEIRDESDPDRRDELQADLDWVKNYATNNFQQGAKSALVDRDAKQQAYERKLGILQNRFDTVNADVQSDAAYQNAQRGIGLNQEDVDAANAAFDADAARLESDDYDVRYTAAQKERAALVEKQNGLMSIYDNFNSTAERDRQYASRDEIASEIDALDEQIAAIDSEWEGYSGGTEDDEAFILQKLAEAQEQLNENPYDYVGEDLSGAEQGLALNGLEAQRDAILSDKQQTEAKLRAMTGTDAINSNEILKMDAEYGYNELDKQADFAENSKPVAGNDIMLTVTTYSSGNQGAIERHDEQVPLTGYLDKYMTDDQLAKAYYLRNTKGNAAAVNYIEEYLKSPISQAKNEAEAGFGQNEADNAGVGSGILGTMGAGIASTYGGALGFADVTLAKIQNWLASKGLADYTQVNPYNDYSNLANAGRTYTDEISNRIEESAGPVAAFLYNAGVSTYNSALTLPLGELGAAAMGMSAGDSAFRQALDSGMDMDQAYASAGATAIIETVTEYVSLDHLFHMKSPESAVDLIKNVLVQGGVEASEEVVGDLAEFFYDNLVNQGMSQINQRIGELMADGMGYNEARTQANKEWFIQVGTDAGSAAISGALFGTVNQAAQGISGLADQTVENQNLGADVESYGNTDATLENLQSLEDEAYALGFEHESYAPKNAKARNLGKKITQVMSEAENLYGSAKSREEADAVTAEYDRRISEKAAQVAADVYSKQQPGTAPEAKSAAMSNGTKAAQVASDTYDEQVGGDTAMEAEDRSTDFEGFEDLSPDLQRAVQTDGVVKAYRDALHDLDVSQLDAMYNRGDTQAAADHVAVAALFGGQTLTDAERALIAENPELARQVREIEALRDRAEQVQPGVSIPTEGSGTSLETARNTPDGLPKSTIRDWIGEGSYADLESQITVPKEGTGTSVETAREESPSTPRGSRSQIDTAENANTSLETAKGGNPSVPKGNASARTTEDRTAIKEALAKYARGEELTDAEKQLVLNDPVANDIYHELYKYQSGKYDVKTDALPDWIMNIERTRSERIARLLGDVGAAPLASLSKDADTDSEGASDEPVDGTPEAAKLAAEAHRDDLQTSDSGETTVTGEAVVPKALRTVGKAVAETMVTVQKADGSTEEVPLSDIAFGSEAELQKYNYAMNMATPALANTFRLSVTEGQSIEDVAAGFSFAYEQGAIGRRYGAGITESILVSALSDDQVKTAYDLGAKDRAAKVEAAQAKADTAQTASEGVLDYGKVTTSGLSEEQKTQLSVVETIVKAAGMKARLYESAANDKGVYTVANGYVKLSTGTISLDINAGLNTTEDSMEELAVVSTLSHEMTHVAQQNAPKVYETYRSLVLGYMEDSGTNIEELIGKAMATDKSLKSRDEALDEIVANASFTMLRDSDYVDRLIKARPAQARTVGQKIVDFLKGLKAVIRKAFAGKAKMRAEVRAVEKYIDQLAKPWADMMLEASGVTEEATTEEKEPVRVEKPAGTVGEFNEPAMPENVHIDQRTWEDVADKGVNAFQNDYKYARYYMGPAAQTLLYDLESTTKGEKMPIGDTGEWTGTKRQTTDELAYLLDEGKWSYAQLGGALTKIVDAYAAGDLEGNLPNSQIVKRVELSLNRILSEGYETLYGVKIAPDLGYIEYKQGLPGAGLGESVPENAEYGMFEGYVGAGLTYVADGEEYVEDYRTFGEDTKFSVRDFGFEALDKETRNNIKMRGGVVANTEQELYAHVNAALSSNEQKNVYIGAISEETKRKIEEATGKSIFRERQYAYAVSYDDIRHIEKHFKQPAEIVDAVEKIYAMLNDFDTIREFYGRIGDQRIEIDKSWNNADYKTINVISKSRRAVDLVTVYITKINIKSGSQSVPLAASRGDSLVRGSASEDSIAQDGEDVKGDNTKFSTRDMSEWSSEMRDVYARLNSNVSVPLEEVNKIPEIVEAAKRVNLTETINIHTPEREALRERIYQDMLKKGSWIENEGKGAYTGIVDRDRIADIVIGLPASGKSSVLVNPLSQFHKARVIDSDMIKERLNPEFDNGYGASAVHEESKEINSRVYETTVESGVNLVLPIIGGTYSKLIANIQTLKRNGYTVYLHLNELQSEKAIGRALRRFMEEDRYIPPFILYGYGDTPTENFQRIIDEGGIVDGYIWKNNDVARGEEPRIIAISRNLIEIQSLNGGRGGRDDRGGQAVRGETESEGAQGDGEEGLSYSVRDPEDISDREILATAFESVAQTSDEKARLRIYKEQIGKYDKLQADLTSKRARIRELTFGKYERTAETRDELARVKNQAEIIAGQVARQDKRLLTLEAAKPLKAVLSRERVVVEREVKAEMSARIKALREQRDAKIEKTKQETRERIDRMRQRRADAEIRHKIKKLVDEFNDRILHPREGHYVPKQLMRLVVELGETINTYRSEPQSAKARDKLAAIRNAYAALKNDGSFGAVYDEGVEATLQGLAESVGDKSIYQLDAGELAQVYDALKVVHKMVVDAVKVFGDEKNRTAGELGREATEELRRARGAFPQFFEALTRWQLSPERMFNRFGNYEEGAWKTMYDILNDGQHEVARIVMESNKIFSGVIEGQANLRNVRTLTAYKGDKLVDVGLRDKQGKAVRITRGMMLSLYMHLLNPQNAEHVYYGGLTMPDLSEYYKGKSEAWGRGQTEIAGYGTQLVDLEYKIRHAETEAEKAALDARRNEVIDEGHRYVENVRANIEGKLTTYERRFLAAAQAYFDDYSKGVLNAATLKRYGFEKARVENYFPIRTDAAYRQASFEQIKRDMSLEAAGFMKERVNAKNPILLEDIVDVARGQIDRVAQYAGMLVPLSDFSKVYSTTTAGYTMSLQKALQSAFGQGATK